ncbi:MAG TPA: carboxypeptidase-like regulatory domain-containing protein, partial [Acidobacteriota bacterium]|nr:carboxypeptidase-like regulatory domain-containing protein [Acidobacteriota bacterium]
MKMIPSQTYFINHQDTKAPRLESSKAWCLGVLVVILFFITSAVTLAQEVTGTIDGLVKDPSGAAIPGAEVTAVHIATGTARKTVSGEDGSYTLPALPIGTYQISAELPGFKKTVQTGLELHIADHLRVDITLQVGEIAQQVSVVAETVQVQTESSEVSELISGDQVRELQLNGRSFMTLLELIPGVASNLPDRM